MNTLQNRMLLTFIILIVFVVTSILIVVQRDVEKTVYSLEIGKSRQEVELITDQIASAYKSYGFYRETLLNERRESLSNLTEMASGVINKAYQQFRSGKITEKEAKYIAKETIRKMRYDNKGGYIFIFEETEPIPTTYMHPVFPELEGKQATSQKHYDALDGKENLLVRFSRFAREHGEAFVNYKWPKPDNKENMLPKIAHVRSFKQWNWIYGASLYVDSIEEKCKKHLEMITNSILKKMSQIRIAKSGYMFVFNGENYILEHPELKGKNGDDVINPVTGEKIFDVLVKAAGSKSGITEYYWHKPGQSRENYEKKIAIVRYFKPLDWYISTSVYQDELRAPAVALRRTVLILAAFFVVFAIFLAWLISRSVSRPLSSLANAAQKIESEGISAVQLDISGTSETKALGKCIQGMIIAIDRAHSYISSIINSMPSVLIGVDPDLKITHWNSKAEEMTGVPSKSAIGKTLSEVYPYFKHDVKYIHQAMKDKTTLSGVRHKRATEDSVRYEDITIYPLSTNGIDGAVVRIDDVTEEHEREAISRHQQKLESIGTLAGGVAHEINNPINIIMNYGQLILDDIDKESAVAEDVREIVRESMRIAEIVKNLLSFSRQDDENFNQASIAEILHSTTKLTKKILSKDQIECELKIDEEKLMVCCRRQQIMQVVMNLITNARDALNERYPEYDDNKKIFLSAGTFQENGNNWVRVTVEDRGSGIPDNIVERIFDPFFTSKPRDKGTGLGLSVSYGIIQDHNGNLKVETVQGEYTRFHVDLPADIDC